MFVHKIDEDLSLKLIELRDGERVFELTNNSRGYLREWLPWLDTTTKLEDTIEFIKISLKGFAENKSLNNLWRRRPEQFHSKTRLAFLVAALPGNGQVPFPTIQCDVLRGD